MNDLLPGVMPDGSAPAVICDAHSEITKARRRALVRDVAQVALLLGANYLFVYWPDARMPFLERGHSLTVLQAMNLAIIAHLWLSRAMPRWRARRVASTWSRSERERFERH